jgi:hypothetical protein
MNVEEAVGMELSACRHKKRISQERLGFDAGVHRTYVSLINEGAKGMAGTVYSCHGAQVVRPRQVLPSPSYVEWYRRNVFQGRETIMEVTNGCTARCQ